MFEIRPAALSEFALLPAVEAEADHAFETLEPPLSIANFAPLGVPADYADAFHIMVAGRPPVGFVQLEIVDGQAHLEQLSVSPEFARQGIGRSLVTAAKAWAAEAGFKSMTLCTFAEIPFNGPFYASCGFAEVVSGQWQGEMRARLQHERELQMAAVGRRIVMRVDLNQR